MKTFGTTANRDPEAKSAHESRATLRFTLLIMYYELESLAFPASTEDEV